jgi:hypothetical protein
MKRLRLLTLLCWLPLAACLVLSAGCGSKSGDEGGGGGGGSKATDGGAKKTDKGASKAGDKTPLEGKATGTITGKVTYDGDPPPVDDLKAQMEKNNDKELCFKGDTSAQMWKVNATDKGVANVVVWLRAPEGKVFDVPEDQHKRTDTVKIDQPHCAFEPHVVAVFPSYFDIKAKEQKPTGQKFEVLNSAPVPHNTAWSGDKLLNAGKNEILKPKGEMKVDAVPGKPKAAGAEELLSINCNIHQWMNAKAWIFDHPYFAVTKDDGSFEIKGVPEGTELVLAYWHESFGDKNSAKTEKITVTGKTEKNLKVKK